ncbi:MAG: 4Fe-4S dicluster domain-containing protein [Proteobacteria bacterium]|nr:4Fe-4S dicluster domain-containing protein [Pseudomonadota bacterium]
MTELLSKQDRKKVESYLNIGEDIQLGEIVVDTSKCVGCQFCARACAGSALEIVDKKCRMIEVLPMCMGCGDCVAACPENAIEMKHYIEFNFFFRFLDRGEPAAPRRF